MRILLALCLLSTAGLAAFAQSAPAHPETSAAETEQLLIRIELSWGDAVMRKDIKAIDSILADDWVAIDYEGKPLTKAQHMADLRAGASAAEDVEYGPINVRLFGDTAVITGSNTEKAVNQGRNGTGKYFWTDVWLKRNGRWQVVASHYTKEAHHEAGGL